MRNVEGFDALGLQGLVKGRSRLASRRPLVLSRALYRQRRFDLSRLSPADRVPSLRLQVASWAPFDDSEYRVSLFGDHAWAYAWDARALRLHLQASGADGSTPKVRPVLPEGVYRLPLKEGVRLLACLEGYEAQCWRAGQLLESRWWPQMPDDEAWQGFCRVSGGSAASITRLPVPLEDRATRSWAEALPLEALGSTGARWERWLAVGALSVTAAWGGYEGRRWYNAEQALELARTQATELTQRAAPQVKARDDALILAEKANRLASALTAPAPLAVLDQLAMGLPPKGVVLQEFLLEGKRLRVVLTLAPEVQRTAVIQQLRSSGAFTEVTEARDQTVAGAVTFDLQLAGLTAVPAVQASAPVGAATQLAPPTSVIAPPTAATDVSRAVRPPVSTGSRLDGSTRP